MNYGGAFAGDALTCLCRTTLEGAIRSLRNEQENSGQVARAKQQQAQHGRPKKAAHGGYNTHAHLFGLVAPHDILHQDAGASKSDHGIVEKRVFFRGGRGDDAVAADNQARQCEPSGKSEEQQDEIVKHGRRALSRFGTRLARVPGKEQDPGRTSRPGN